LLTGTGVNVPNQNIDNVDFSGTASPTLIEINYIIYFTSGGTAVGKLVFDTQLGIENIESEIGHDFVLSQNFPNPFNPNTSINFSLPVDIRVSLSIYSLSGQLIRQLVNQSLNSGEYSIVWDGKDSFGNSVSGGVYIYNLQIEDTNLTKKMILLK